MDTNPEQSILEPCNTQREFYKQLREIKTKPVWERIDHSFQIEGIIHGQTCIILIVAVLIVWFKNEIWAFVKNPKQAIEDFFKKG